MTAEIKSWERNHPARKIFDDICWEKFGKTFNDLCENESNQQSGFWLELILPAMEEYKSQSSYPRWVSINKCPKEAGWYLLKAPNNHPHAAGRS